MNALVQAQVANNCATAANWAAFAGHRARVTALLRARSTASRLCVLGAGNCNDLDLEILCASHSEVHLVDLDAVALSRAMARQTSVRRAVRLHAPLDVSANLEIAARWSPATSLTDAEVARCAQAPATIAGRLPGPFELTASNCVLSQLIDGLV